MKFTVLLTACVISIASLAAEPAFEGFMITSGRPLFVVSSEKEKKSGWISLGQTFDGITIVAFQPGPEVLVVEKDGKRQELRLRDSKVRDSKPEDRKVRLSSLKGMELAYELAKDGDDQITALLSRYQDRLPDLQHGRVSKEVVDFLRTQIDRMAVEKAAQILAKQ